MKDKNRHIIWCLTSSGECLDCTEEDAQLVLSAFENGRPIPSVTIYLAPGDAAALGAWLIEGANHILDRYPEMK